MRIRPVCQVKFWEAQDPRRGAADSGPGRRSRLRGIRLWNQKNLRKKIFAFATRSAIML